MTTEVQAVRIFCKGEGGILEKTTIPSDHTLFNERVSPLSAAITLPIHVYREGPLENAKIHPERALYDNAPATKLMIELEDGLAPPDWQCGVGTVLVARKDKKPLSVEHMEALMDFVEELLWNYPDDINQDSDITRNAFEKHFQSFKWGCVKDGEADWREVVSPYAV
jgi:hypothetical protein